MGSMLAASCPCGYESSLSAGGGMLDFHTVCLVPAICPTCKEVVVVNAMKADTACPECGGKTTMIGGFSPPNAKPDRVVFNWSVDPLGTYVLEDRAYRCPKCSEMKLKFGEVGSWD